MSTPHLATQRPAISVKLDVSGNPITSTPTWTDITPFAREQLTTKRGRQNKLDRIEVGESNVTTDDGDRRFEAEYAGSPYYPNLTLMRPMQMKATVSAVDYFMHTGFLQTLPTAWPGAKRAQNALVSADAFAYLDGQLLTQTFSTNLTGSMINAVLDAAGWPSGAAWRNIDPGAETSLGIAAAVTSALEIIQTLADTETGLFFFDGQGRATFHDRDHRIRSARSTTIQTVFGDIGTVALGELPYLSPDTEYDIARVYNDVQVSSGLASPTMIPQTDATSQQQFGRRTLQRTTTLTLDAAASDQGVRILKESKDPHLRLPTLTIDPARDSRLWPVILGMEISDRIKVIRRPYASVGAPISKELWVEAIEHVVTIGARFSWLTTLSLSLADPVKYWALDSATQSQLDSTTILR